jgi:hypothetical protein
MKGMKIIILLILGCLFTTISVFAQTYSGGNGTEETPYLISSKADMDILALAVSEGKNYPGEYFLLIRDLTGADDIVTTIIGNSLDYSFHGVFD